MQVGKARRLPMFGLSANLRMRRKALRFSGLRTDRCLNDMLIDGGIDAIISASAPKGFVAGDSRITRLFVEHGIPALYR